MEAISAIRAGERIISALGMTESAQKLDETQVLAGLVRRAASVATPCPPRSILQRVLLGLRGLTEAVPDIEASVDSVIEALTAYGDLIELPASKELGASTYLYSAPPGFVETSPDRVFLLGIPPDGQDLLPAKLARRIEYRGHVRSIQYDEAEALPLTLRQLGLHAIPEKLWFRQPLAESAQATKERYDQKLDQTHSAGDIDQLLILDTSKPVTYYRGRWGPPKRLSGRYVARREQRYGAPLWCYVQLEDGVPSRLLDLLSGEWRGCDLAWRLQMAIDALAGAPQQFTADFKNETTVIVKVFSPLPAWWQKRWDVLGTRVQAPRCLHAYELEYTQYETDLPRLRDELWLCERMEHT